MIKKENSKNKKITGLCHGVFDLIHAGHIYHLKEAKKLCNYLVVSVTADEHVNKGPNRPYFPLKERVAVLKSLKFIDLVIPSYHENAIYNIRKIKPNFYFKDQEYQKDSKKKNKTIYKEAMEVKKFSGKIIFTNSKTYSSSKVLNNKIYNIFFSKYTKLNGLLNYYEDQCYKIMKKKILIIGETILDQYSYVFPINKSNKENLIANSIIKSETYFGGAFVVAKIASEFSKNVTLLTGIQKNKSDRINISGLKIENLVTTKFKNIKKNRFVETDSLNKIFLTYEKIKESSLYNFDKISKYLKNNISTYDLIIVYDFGHSLFNNDVIKILNNTKKYTSINCQSNSLNLGFNLITRYKKCNKISIDLNELKLATGIKDINFEEFTKKLKKNINFDQLDITLGKNGSISFYKKKYFKVPALFNDRALDTMGAGDIFHLISSIMSYKNNNVLNSSSIANIASGLKVKEWGHTKEFYKKEIKKILEVLNK